MKIHHALGICFISLVFTTTLTAQELLGGDKVDADGTPAYSSILVGPEAIFGCGGGLGVCRGGYSLTSFTAGGRGYGTVHEPDSLVGIYSSFVQVREVNETIEVGRLPISAEYCQQFGGNAHDHFAVTCPGPNLVGTQVQVYAPRSDGSFRNIANSPAVSLSGGRSVFISENDEILYRDSAGKIFLWRYQVSAPVEIRSGGACTSNIIPYAFNSRGTFVGQCTGAAGQLVNFRYQAGYGFRTLPLPPGATSQRTPANLAPNQDFLLNRYTINGRTQAMLLNLGTSQFSPSEIYGQLADNGVMVGYRSGSSTSELLISVNGQVFPVTDLVTLPNDEVVGSVRGIWRDGSMFVVSQTGNVYLAKPTN